MAKLAILRPLNQIARPLEGTRTEIAIEVFRVIFGALYQDHFLNSKIFIFYSTLFNTPRQSCYHYVGYNGYRAGTRPEKRAVTSKTRRMVSLGCQLDVAA